MINIVNLLHSVIVTVISMHVILLRFFRTGLLLTGPVTPVLSYSLQRQLQGKLAVAGQF